MINYDNRTFKAVHNTINAEVNDETVFQYQQEGNLVSAIYNGGTILFGQLIATVNDSGELDMRYHHLNIFGELKSGICFTRPEILPNGKIRLHERWKWTTGDDDSEGESILEEI